MSEKMSAAKILTDFLSPVSDQVYTIDDRFHKYRYLGLEKPTDVIERSARTTHELGAGTIIRIVTGDPHLDDFGRAHRADAIVIPVEAHEKTTGNPAAKVLGFLAANGPTRSVALIDQIVDEDNPKSSLSLTTVAAVIDKLVAEGTLERRDGERIAVLGDPR